MPCPGLLPPEPLPLWQATADLYLHRRHSNIVLPQSLEVLWVLVCERFVWALRASLVGMGLIINADLSLLPSFWGFSLAQDMGYLLAPALHTCRSSAAQVPLQHLPFCWGFSALGPGLSPQSRSSAAPKIRYLYINKYSKFAWKTCFLFSQIN